MNLYSASQLRFEYPLGNQKVTALEGVTLELPAAQIVVLTGPSGSGKSTLLNLLGLIEPLQGGELTFGECSLRTLSESRKNEIRRKEVGFIFQNFHLFPILTAEENVEFFLIRQKVAASERARRVRMALEAVGLWERRKNRPLELSGGQRQRVAIARAIAKSPKVIIADEPTASLDSKTGREIMDIFREYNRTEGMSFVISSHDPLVESYATHHVSLRDGKVL